LDPETLNEAVETVLFEDRPTGQFKINMEKLVDMRKAKRDAKALFEATEDQIGTNEKELIRLFAVPEIYQSRATYDEYVKVQRLCYSATFFFENMYMTNLIHVLHTVQ
jgi:hypothetical protein